MIEAQFDVVIVGGGPAGLSAALTLGRARARVLLCDAGDPRNARAVRIQGFVTRDGTPPQDFRRIGREQLASYPSVELRRAAVESISGAADRFEVSVAGDVVTARRVVLALGMRDEMLPLPGYSALWGRAIFQCPYCHGWEVRDQRFGYLAPSLEQCEWARMLLGWSREVMVFTDAAFEVDAQARSRLAALGIGLEERALERLVAAEDGEHLLAIELEDGTKLERDVLFSHPPQRQSELVRQLALPLNDLGFVRVDATQQTERRGIYAAGDLTSNKQGALVAAAAGAQAAYALGHDLAFS